MTTLCLSLFRVTLASSNADDLPGQSALSTDAIVQKLIAANARRADRLRGYRGKRIYQLDYHGLFGGHAEMQVEATYRAPDKKDFKIISESGSKLLIHQVLLKLLQSEHDAQAISGTDRHHAARGIDKLISIMEVQRYDVAGRIVVGERCDCRLRIARPIENSTLALLRHPLSPYRKRAQLGNR